MNLKQFIEELKEVSTQPLTDIYVTKTLGLTDSINSTDYLQIFFETEDSELVGKAYKIVDEKVGESENIMIDRIGDTLRSLLNFDMSVEEERQMFRHIPLTDESQK